MNTYFALTPAQAAFQQEIAQFALTYVEPLAQELDATARFPGETVALAAERGYMGLVVPTQYGGSARDHLSFALFVEEIASACAATAVILDVHTSVGSEPLVLMGSAQQKERYLPELASGRYLGAFALTEPESGSDAAALRTTAVRDGDDYLLNGSKIFITNAGKAGLYTVLASTDRTLGARGISAFLVEADAPGLSIGAPLHKLGLHGSSTAELTFQDCRVPASCRLGREGEGFTVAMKALDSGRIGISAQALGLARAALDEALTALKDGEIRPGQGLEFALAELATALAAARALTWQAARLCDQGQPFSALAAMAKLRSTDTAMQVTSEMLALVGAEVCTERRRRLERYYRDAKATQLYEGTNQIQRLVIARSVLGAGARPTS